MKKMIFCAIAVWVAGCYTPMNNSGVATNKPWIEIPAKRVDFDGKQYDSCVQFKLRFWPQEAADRIDLQESCITACCWRSERDEVVLDFNKKFEEELRQYGRARKYSPEKITFKVTHSNLVNITKVTTDPRGAVKNSGMVKLSYKVVDDPVRLAQIEQELAWKDEIVPDLPTQETTPGKKTATSVTPVAPRVNQDAVQQARAKALVQRLAGTKIDNYFYQMNKNYIQKGAIFILSSRLWTAQKRDDGAYVVTCHAKARTGIDQSHLNSSDFPCGTWLADVNAQLILPYDNKAKQIYQ